MHQISFIFTIKLTGQLHWPFWELKPFHSQKAKQDTLPVLNNSTTASGSGEFNAKFAPCRGTGDSSRNVWRDPRHTSHLYTGSTYPFSSQHWTIKLTLKRSIMFQKRVINRFFYHFICIKKEESNNMLKINKICERVWAFAGDAVA